jgi:hypothetical protein
MDTKYNTCLFCRKGNFPSSHPMVDRNGKTICKKLLGTKCTFCSEFGHTIKFCKQSKIKQFEAEQFLQFNILINAKANNIITKKNRNKYNNIQNKFINFLKNKFGSEWLNLTLNTCYDCVFLHNIRIYEMEQDCANIRELATWLGNKEIQLRNI